MANVFDQVSAPASAPVPPVGTVGLVWGYAGFWWRVLAWWIDSLILGVVTFLIDRSIGVSMLGHMGMPAIPAGGIVNVSDRIDMTVRHAHLFPGLSWPDPVGFLLPLAYFALLESSRWQATVGKRVCRLRVTGLDGGRISLGRAVGRYFGKFLSALMLGLGFLMIAWTQRKQGLHDLLASTLVVRLRAPSDLARFNPPS